MKSENIDKYDMVQLLKTLGSRWNLLIIWNLQEESLRFTELQKRMGDINSNTLTEHLRFLEKYIIVNRTVYPEVPPRVEYSLTEHGKAFLPILKDIKEWGRSAPPPKN